MPEELIVGFDPTAATQRVQVAGKAIKGRLLWLGVSVMISVWIYLWRRQFMSREQGFLLLLAALAYSLLWLVLGVVSWVRARSALKAIRPGVAVRVDRQGLWMSGRYLAWDQVEGIAARAGRGGGIPRLSVVARDGTKSMLPMADLDVMPDTIDSSIRSFSSGRWAISTAKLGN